MQNKVFTVLQNVSNVFSFINGKKENTFEHKGMIAPDEQAIQSSCYHPERDGLYCKTGRGV